MILASRSEAAIDYPCCLGCGAIAGGTYTGQQLSRDSRLRLVGRHRIGQTGTARDLGLPSWCDPILNVIEPPIRSKRLIQAWSGMGRAQRQYEICQRVGLQKGEPVAIAAIDGVPGFSFDLRVIAHILDGGTQNHIKYAPLLPNTLSHPLEVWSREHDGNPDQLLFLRKYQEGANELTYLVVGDGPGGFLKTAYRLNGYRQAEAMRRGTFLYGSWILRAI